jgi:hypothetical protein
VRCIREGKNLVKDTKEDTDSHIIADAPGTLLLQDHRNKPPHFKVRPAHTVIEREF